MSDLFENHIVGFPTRRLISWTTSQEKVLCTFVNIKFYCYNLKKNLSMSNWDQFLPALAHFFLLGLRDFKTINAENTGLLRIGLICKTLVM